MEYIADFHIHSRHAMACSPNITIEGIDEAAKEKGVKVIGTGDFTHPLWVDELKMKLEDAEPGLYKVKGSKTGTRFVLSSEVSNIFDAGGKNRRVHNCILVPSLDDVDAIIDEVKTRGALESDGRPALSMSCSELVEKVIGVNRDAIIFPAHSWTPWFGVLGSFSGFDSIEEAYGDQAKYIYCAETGLSADPAMFWRLSKLDKYLPISNSDAHSLPKIGREATVFEFSEDGLSYAAILNAIKNKKLKKNIEFYPDEGKYHYDGHRNCQISLSPKEAQKYNGRCPKCGRPLTIGVEHRVDQLADRPEGHLPKAAIPTVHAVPLLEIIAQVKTSVVTSTAVKRAYNDMLARLGTEFDILLNIDPAQIAEMDADVAKGIENVRTERVKLIPGYDGVFGVVDVMNKASPDDKKPKRKQASMSDFD